MDNLSIVKYLMGSILCPKLGIVPTVNGLLSEKGRVQAIVDIIARIGQNATHHLAGMIAVMLMQKADKTVYNRAVIEKLINV